MVDPNRKINRLSDDDAAFLVECEQEFRHRYTDADEEFIEFCSKINRPPPIIEQWQVNRRSNSYGRGGGGSNNSWNRNNRNNFHSNSYRGDRHHKRQFNRNYHQNPYEERNFRRDGDGDASTSSKQSRSNASPY